MEVSIQLEPGRRQPRIVIYTSEVTPEVTALVQRLEERELFRITGHQEGLVRLLEPEEIFRLYTQGGKVYAQTGEGDYLVRLRLYELEQRLDPSQFVRISSGEIVQLKQVRHFDLNFAGTIRVMLNCGTVSYVSRRYMAKIKRALGL